MNRRTMLGRMGAAIVGLLVSRKAPAEEAAEGTEIERQLRATAEAWNAENRLTVAKLRQLAAEFEQPSVVQMSQAMFERLDAGGALDVVESADGRVVCKIREEWLEQVCGPPVMPKSHWAHDTVERYTLGDLRRKSAPVAEIEDAL